MSQTWNQWIDELLSKTDIVKVISRYVPLTKKGRTWWGCCPFHAEKTPSFAVNEEKQFYNCFGCPAGGNAITFIEKIENIDRIDAIKILAAEAKMELPKFAHDNSNGLSREKRERYYALMRDAARHYHENLDTPGGKHARKYIEDRQIPPNLVKKFGFGVSLNGDEMINYLKSKGYTLDEMKAVGLAGMKGDRYYDVFFERFIIPIINNFGEVVAFSGRLITPETHVHIKYYNSPATVIFDKSRNLYAINLLKKKKQRDGKLDYVIMCEGYMDVLALHKSGFDVAVASMGTSLTFSQAKLLRNYCPNVYISYDGDSAGQGATLRGLDILTEAGLNVKVVTLPDGLDPDDLIKAQGKEAYAKLLAEAQTLPAFKINNLKSRYDLNTPDGKSKYAMEAVKVIKALPNPIEQEEYLKIIHEHTGYSYDTLRKQAEMTDPEQDKPRVWKGKDEIETDATPVTDKPRNASELFIIAAIAHGKEYVSFNDDVDKYLTLDSDKQVYQYALTKFKQGEKPVVSSLYSFLDKPLADEIVTYDFMRGDGEDKYKTCLKQLKIRKLTQDKTQLAAEYDTSKDAHLLMQIMKIERQLSEIKGGGN